MESCKRTRPQQRGRAAAARGGGGLGRKRKLESHHWAWALRTKASRARRSNTGTQGEQEALSLSSAAIPHAETPTLFPGLRRISPPPCSHQQGSLRRPLPGGSPLTLKAFSYVRKSGGPGSLESGARLGPHSHPRSGCARHPRAPKRGAPREAGAGFPRAHCVGHSPFLTMAAFSFPQATCWPTDTSSWGRPLVPKTAQDNSAVIYFLPGNHAASSHPGTHFLLTASSAAQTIRSTCSRTSHTQAPARPLCKLPSQASLQTHQPLRGRRMGREGGTLHSSSPRVSTSPPLFPTGSFSMPVLSGPR